MKHYIKILCLGLLIVISCRDKVNQLTNGTYTAEIFTKGSDEYGYDIYKDSSLVIHQPVIPAFSGNSGFHTEEDAKKVAGLMIYKLSKGIMPPAISINELDSLKIQLH